jgi:site-specific recombinase XerD
MAIPQLASSQLTCDVLSGYIKAFLDSLNGGRTQTLATYECGLRDFVRWFERDGRFLFAVDDVYRYKDYLTKSRKLRPASVSTYLNALRQLCKYLHQHGVITYNPAKHVRSFVRRRTAGFEALTQIEVDRLIGSVDQNDRRGMRDTIIIRLMVEYGVAEIELIRLDVGDYVFIAAIGALKLWEREKKSKLLLRQDMTALMNQYLASRPQLKNEHPLFLSDGNRTRGMRMTTRGIRARVNHYLALAGLFDAGSRKITPRVLRHTAAILMAEGGASADEIKYRMRFGSLAKAEEYVRQVSLATQVS